MATLLQLCNLALAGIAKGSIQSLNEASREAEECKRFAPFVLAEMAEWSDALPFARGRVQLAEVPNDRPDEWLHAFAAPHDLASPQELVGASDGLALLGGAASNGFPAHFSAPLAYAYENSVIYANAGQVVLHYTRNDLQAHEMPAMFQTAFVAMLESKIAGPLTKDMVLVEKKTAIARTLKLEAIADEESKRPRRQAEYISEAEKARMGVGGW